MTKESVKGFFDTNVWISFLIGKHLAKIKKHTSEGRITIITSEQLRVVTGDKDLTGA